MTCPDFAEALQARLLSQREADRRSLRRLSGSDERGWVKALKAYIATLEDAVANAEALGERGQEAGITTKRLEAMEARIATLQKAVTTARNESETAARRLEALVARIAILENAVANAEALGGTTTTKSPDRGQTGRWSWMPTSRKQPKEARHYNSRWPHCRLRRKTAAGIAAFVASLRTSS